MHVMYQVGMVAHLLFHCPDLKVSVPRSISKSIPISAISPEDNGADPEVDHREEEMEEGSKI